MENVISFFYHPLVWLAFVIVNGLLFWLFSNKFKDFTETRDDRVMGTVLLVIFCIGGVLSTMPMLLAWLYTLPLRTAPINLWRQEK